MKASARQTVDIATDNYSLVVEIAGGQSLTSEAFEGIADRLKEAFPGEDFAYIQSRNISPYFAHRFFQNAATAIIIAAILMLLYVWFSFRRIHGLSAGIIGLLALLHDMIFVFLAFVVFRIPINENYVAVTLTILGYSINSTIVNFDRIRENSLSRSKSMTLEQITNRSISQSMTRNINTNITTLIAIVLVFIFAALNGLESIRTFALPMGVGIVSGFFSSVFIAAPTWALREQHKKKTAG